MREMPRATKRSLGLSQTPEEQRPKTRGASREAAQKPPSSDSPAKNSGKQSSGSPPMKPRRKGNGGAAWNKGLRVKQKGLPITLQNSVPAGKVPAGKGGAGGWNRGLRVKEKGLRLTLENAVPAGKGGARKWNRGLRVKEKGLRLTLENAVSAAAAAADVPEKPAKDTAAEARKAASPAAEQRPEVTEPTQLQRDQAQSVVRGKSHVVRGKSLGPSGDAPSARPRETLPLAGKAFKLLWS